MNSHFTEMEESTTVIATWFQSRSLEQAYNTDYLSNKITSVFLRLEGNFNVQKRLDLDILQLTNRGCAHTCRHCSVSGVVLFKIHQNTLAFHYQTSKIH